MLDYDLLIISLVWDLLWWWGWWICVSTGGVEGSSIAAVLAVEELEVAVLILHYAEVLAGHLLGCPAVANLLDAPVVSLPVCHKV